MNTKVVVLTTKNTVEATEGVARTMDFSLKNLKGAVAKTLLL